MFMETRRRAIMILVCLGVLLSALPHSANSQPVLKVMTYNIQGMRPGSEPETRLTHIIQNLKRIDPDIIGLQEINERVGGDGTDNQAKAIAESLSTHFGIPYYWHSTATHIAWWGEFVESIGIITKYRIRAMDAESLETTDFNRKVFWNLIETPLGLVNFFTTHLSSNEPYIGALQGAHVKAFVTEKEHTVSAVATIVTGDFNGTPASDVVQLFVAGTADSCYVDSFAEANPGSPGYTAPAGGANIRIDYVLLKRTGSLALESSIVECDEPYAPDAYSSDHYAVLTTLSTRRLEHPRLLNFAPTLIGRTDTLSLRLSNRSLQPVTVLSVTAGTGAFQILPGTRLPAALATRGASISPLIRFEPSAEGTITDTITVGTDDPFWPTARIAVTGIAVERLAPASPGVCYTISRGTGEDVLGTLNLATAAPVTIGLLGYAGMTGLAVRPTTAELYAVRPGSVNSALVIVGAESGTAISAGTIPVPGVRTIAFGPEDTLYAGTEDGRLVRVDIEQRSIADVMRFNGMGFGGICYDNQQRKILATTYLPPFTNDSLYVIDPHSGGATLVGSTGLWIVTSSIAMDSTGALYGLTGTDVNLLIRINTATAAGEPVGTDAFENYAAMAIRTKPGGTTAAPSPATIPLRSELLGNYPNPFNGGTRILFTTACEERVVLEIFNLLGELVRTLVDGVRVAGTYRVDFHAPDLPGGVYFCRLRTGSLAQTMRMLFLK
jgi:endonuclease/exonuclease/phosphatase family metal-dependent hydrolase